MRAHRDWTLQGTGGSAQAHGEMPGVVWSCSMHGSRIWYDYFETKSQTHRPSFNLQFCLAAQAERQICHALMFTCPWGVHWPEKLTHWSIHPASNPPLLICSQSTPFKMGKTGKRREKQFPFHYQRRLRPELSMHELEEHVCFPLWLSVCFYFLGVYLRP